MSAVLLLIFVAGFAISRFVPDYGWNRAYVLPGLGLGLLGYVLIPAVFLVLGAGVAGRVQKIPSRAI
jgi:hypothetical protein